MTAQIDETFSAALRELLIEQVQTSSGDSRWLAGPRKWVAAAGAALALGVTGTGIAYAAGAFTSSLPGGPATTDLSVPVGVTGTGTETVKLGRRPAGATSLFISFTCLTAGDFTFADGASVQCLNTDIGQRSAQVTDTIKLAPRQDSTQITATPGTRWRLRATYVSVTTTAWGVNARGQTYGVQDQQTSRRSKSRSRVLARSVRSRSP